MTKQKVNKKFTNFGTPSLEDDQPYLMIPVADSVLQTLGLVDVEEDEDEEDESEEEKNERKIFVLDTSVLLYDKDSMFKLFFCLHEKVLNSKKIPNNIFNKFP